MICAPQKAIWPTRARPVPQPEIVYCIEHVARELDIACAVRHLARARYGLHVDVLVLARNLEAALAQRNPAVVAVPFFRSRGDYGVQTVLRRCPGVPIVNAACEQLLSPGNRRFRMPADRIARNDTLHVAAGAFFRQETQAILYWISWIGRSLIGSVEFGSNQR